MQKEKWLVFYSGDVREVENIEEMVLELSGIELEIVTESPLLRGKVMLPFIETENGSRLYGLKSIEKYSKDRNEVQK